MTPQALYWLVIAIVLAEFLYSAFLTLLNIRASHAPIPALLKDLYDEERYRKQQDYAMTNRKFSLVSGLVSTLITLGIFAFGGFAVFDRAARAVSASPVVQALVFWGIFYLVSWVVSLPFDIYRTFVIEQRFGFNRSTPKLFAADAVKSLLLNMVIMGTVLALCATTFSVATSTGLAEVFLSVMQKPPVRWLKSRLPSPASALAAIGKTVSCFPSPVKRTVRRFITTSRVVLLFVTVTSLPPKLLPG